MVSVFIQAAGCLHSMFSNMFNNMFRNMIIVTCFVMHSFDCHIVLSDNVEGKIFVSFLSRDQSLVCVWRGSVLVYKS